MTFSTYADLNQKMIEHFQAGEFQQALDLIEREGANFPANRPLVDYWRMCSAARSGNNTRVYEVARKLHQDGIWFGEVMWRRTPSFKSLQGDADFERLVAESQKLQLQDAPADVPVILKHLSKGISRKTPLLIALHGNQATAAGTLPFWVTAVDQGVALALPQSGQAMFKDAFVWDDLPISFSQIKACFETLRKEIEFDADRVILGGHSMGGFVAIQMALAGEVPVHGLIANGPALPFEDAPEEFEKALVSAKERGLRTYFIMGDNDDLIEQDAIRTFVDKMKSAGVPCKLQVVPGATHDYNPGYDAALVNALDFINS